MKQAEFKEKCKSLGIALTEDMMAQFEQYLKLLQEWNEKMNLTAITEEEEVYEKHFYDCLLPLQHVKLKGKVADVGSGAGFPGLVFAIVHPEVSFTLIEPTGKRCTFLNEVINQLGLKNVTVENERSEDYVKEHRECFDFVTARAVANLPVLSELCLPLCKVNGIFLALKGNKGEEELEMAKHALDVLGKCKVEPYFDQLPNEENRWNLVIIKQAKTPMQYPRPYGRIKKKPL